ncbi:UNVERIFIED_CONTAM: hypothetical protein Sangu_2968200 [Sesamum angustifolium]|uniref:Retroviral polymerase SH3-like domain-containing protein n=1 Tax=Sesamum angustifolium TaxID=2727405 RepID=A0AAW2IK11_9LAMI
MKGELRQKIITKRISLNLHDQGSTTSATNDKRLVGDKLDSRSSMCRFVGYPKETMGYYFYDPPKQKIFISRNIMFLEKGFPVDSQLDDILLEETSETPHQNDVTLFEPMVPTDSVPVLRKSTRESRPPDRYDFSGLTSQLDNDPSIYEEVKSDIQSDKWLEAMKFKIDSMDSNQVWTLVDLPKGVKPAGANRSTNISLELMARLLS